MVNSYLFGFDSDLPLGVTTNHTQSGQASRPDSEVKHLQDRVDRLALICMAMWSLLQDKAQVTEDDLMERVKMLDLMDGTEDGKATRTVSKCTACNRPMNPRHQKCIYCGSAKVVRSAFDAL